MKKLHSFAIYALAAPALALGSGPLLAQQSTGQDLDRGQETSQRDAGSVQSTPKSVRGEQSSRGAGQDDERASADREKMSGQSDKENRGYTSSAPANGMRASNLMGADIKTSANEDVGSVDDLIIDEDGQIVAIVFGVGGFLGIGEKDVAIGWDDVTNTGSADDMELRVDQTRDDLRSAPEFNRQN